MDYPTIEIRKCLLEYHLHVGMVLQTPYSTKYLHNERLIYEIIHKELDRNKQLGSLPFTKKIHLDRDDRFTCIYDVKKILLLLLIYYY